MSIIAMQDMDLSEQSVLIREDLNVPIVNGSITNDARLQASLPTIRSAIKQARQVLICSHLGRPTEGSSDEEYSLAPVAAYLSQQLNQPVTLATDYLDADLDNAGDVILLENVRFNQGEKANDATLAKQYAALADVFVMDAFGTAHRAQASTEGVIQAMTALNKPVCAGPLLVNELAALDTALKQPKAPMVAIVGGSKVSTKLEVITSLAKTCEQIIVGGGIANTFLAAQGHNVGSSLYEKDMIDTARHIMTQTGIILPSKVMVAKKEQVDFDDFIGSLQRAAVSEKPVSDIQDDDMILDASSGGMHDITQAIANAKTILWNGPLGVFEVDTLAEGTQKLAEAIAKSSAFSIAGGGDTLAAVHKFNVAKDISYLSTGGGAFLEFVEGKPLPAVVALDQSKH